MRDNHPARRFGCNPYLNRIADPLVRGRAEGTFRVRCTKPVEFVMVGLNETGIPAHIESGGSRESGSRPARPEGLR